MDRKTTPRQQSILDVIRDFRREHGYPPSVREIGERVGLSSSSTVQCHLRTLEKKGLIKRDPTKPRALVSGNESHEETLSLPVMGRIAAGWNTEAIQNVEEHFTVPATFVKNSGSFMLRVKGDSMVDAAILDGDLVVVNPQAVANNGEIVVAYVDDSQGGDWEATLKTYHLEGNRVRLQPENKFMEPRYTTNAKIVGKVTAVIRKLS